MNQELIYLCLYEAKNNMDNSHHHGAFVYGAVIPAIELYSGNG